MVEVGKKDFSNAKIYCIRNSVNDEIYVGSTCQSLSKRMAYHRGSVNTDAKKDRKLSSMMHKLGIENFYIEKIQDCPECKNVEDLNKIEGEYIRQMGTLNMQIQGRTKQEYYGEHKQAFYETNV